MSVVNETASLGIISLGEKRELPVIPQKHARLRRHLKYEDFQAIMSKEYSQNAYKLLCTLIPAMDPKLPESVARGTAIEEWEFDGFHTEEAWRKYHSGDESAYDEDNDPSPTTDEIAIAFETALKVNGAGRLGKIVTMVQAATRVIELEQPQSEMVPSSTQPGNSGASGSTNSGTTPQTSL